MPRSAVARPGLGGPPVLLTGVATEPDQAGGVFVHRGHRRGVRLPEPPLALPLEHGLLWRGSLDGFATVSARVVRRPHVAVGRNSRMERHARPCACRTRCLWRDALHARVQGGMEDLGRRRGRAAVRRGRDMARNVALLCLSIRSLAHAAPLDLDRESVCFDVFDRVPADETAQARAAREALDIDDDGAAAWLERFAAFVAETEHLLGYGGPLPL